MLCSLLNAGLKNITTPARIYMLLVYFFSLCWAQSNANPGNSHPFCWMLEMKRGNADAFPDVLPAPQGNQREKHTQSQESVEVALIFIWSSCLYLRQIPLTTLKWKCVGLTQGCGERGASFLLNYIWQSSRKHMLPDNLPKVLMKDMGLIFPTTLRLCLCVCVCPWVNVLFVWVRFPSSPLTVSPFCQRLWASIFFDELEKSQCPCVGASVLGSGGIISIL